MNISTFFPAYNEEENIADVIREARQVLEKVSDDYEIIVVLYEGSTDGTADIVRRFQEENDRIRLIIQPLSDRGYGAALKYGFNACRYPFIFYSDSDNQFDLGELERFVDLIADSDIVIGYRMKRQDPFLRILAAYIYNAILRLVIGIPFKDVDCSFKLFRRETLEGITVQFAHLADGEIISRILHKGYRITETGVHHFPRRKGKVVSCIGGGLLRPSLVLEVLKEIRSLHKELKGKGAQPP